ncbi:hypothetical protein L1987_05222 [Smallanthus sonchifolius]|uniref:Uncharacterized protein n=1 Tax=Smallanthus sonchifolius TaxID=185202 RepID=A0ACB9JUS4_9ASTR|nr:hypothetical protein L1987_05222 [Smallanthus sonchifolius]
MSTGELLNVEPLELKFPCEDDESKEVLRSSQYRTLTMQAQKEAPPDMLCRDKFLLQSVVISPGIQPRTLPQKWLQDSLTNLETGGGKMDGLYGLSNMSERVLRDMHHFVVQNLNLQARSLISKLTNEKNAAIQQRDKIRQEIELLTRGGNKSQGGGVSIVVVITICLIGLVMGFLMKK